MGRDLHPSTECLSSSSRYSQRGGNRLRQERSSQVHGRALCQPSFSPHRSCPSVESPSEHSTRRKISPAIRMQERKGGGRCRRPDLAALEEDYISSPSCSVATALREPKRPCASS